VLLVEGYLTYDAYTSFATTLYGAKTTNNASWTTANIQAAAPVANWINASYAAMGLQSLAVLSWLGVALGGMGGQFLAFSKTALLFPIIEAALYFYAYNSYTDCASTTITQFDQTTSGVTQLSSCKSASLTSTLTGYFGTSGTWAPSVSTDPYDTWLGINLGSDLAMALVSFAAMPAFAKAYGGPKKGKKGKKDQAGPGGPKN
jgi:hypothetical protein